MRNLVLLMAVLGLAGCEDRAIRVYEIPKETVETTAPATRPSGGPRWEVPSVWKELPPSGMRAASFSAPGAEGASIDISVVTFPGEAGGLLANVNRWRGQMKLEPAATADDLETLSAGDQRVQIVELRSPDGIQAMLGALLLRADQSWFVKLTGKPADLDQERARFRQFASSFRFPAGDQPGNTTPPNE